MTPDAPAAAHGELRRSSDDRVLLGVCAGLARTLELRPLLVRGGAVLLGALAFPLLVVGYAALALIVPRDDGRALLGGTPHDGREQLLGWSAVLFAGLLLLAAGFRPEQLVWPALDRGGLVLAAFGIGLLVVREGRGAAAAPAVPGASAPGAPPAAGPPAPPAPAPAAPAEPVTTVDGTAVTIAQPALPADTTIVKPADAAARDAAVPSARGLARFIPGRGRGDRAR